MRAVSLLAALAFLAGCGGGYQSAEVTRFATGPLYSACMASDRSARNRALCGCVQAQADRDLQRGDQRQARRFFDDPHQAQVVKMSKTQRDDDFWDRYTRFASNSERTCRGL